MEDDECTQPRSIKLTGKNRCYIFSNTFDNSTTLPKLPGYKKDEESITKLFKWLNFSVIYHFDKDQQALIKEIYTITHNTDFDNHQCAVFFFLSHGSFAADKDGIKRPRVKTSDEKSLEIHKDIVEKIQDSKALENIPKLFFIQACRGSEVSESFKLEQRNSTLERDNGTYAAHHQEKRKVRRSDTLLFYSSLPDTTSFVSDQNGSFFIQKLCKIMSAYIDRDDTEFHLGDVITKVNDVLSKIYREGKDEIEIQCSEAQSSLTTHIYFKPIEKWDSFVNKFKYESKRK